MIDLEPVKLLNLKNQKKTAYSKPSINDFQDLLQAKTANIKHNEQLHAINPASTYLIEPSQEYKSELLKRAKIIIQKLELLKLQILNCSSVSQCINELAKTVQNLESLQDDSETFVDVIIRAKVEIAKYHNKIS
jgi:hypothetical protein